MKILFGFSLRLFIAFITAKLVLRLIGQDDTTYLVGLTIFFIGNTYLFDLLEYKSKLPIDLMGYKNKPRAGRRRDQDQPDQGSTSGSESSSSYLSPPEGRQ
ncbi:MAG: hypothetical protein JRI57_01785 [Deltaproteobacteria bacterium]|nr:hypothetical protein [Deltaproteobacteria bacterium]MBW1953267.1 hypothetical protein [Deltaproteobacteria bacterium]MBW1986408.1 hypothetical protein [Deltaproteobacteria bacterium]MBW2133803.1 hypothetical protein [Deltaproteobacteria bacterium]